MQRDPRSYLWDALEAGRLTTEFTRDMTLFEYRDDLLRQAAVERKLEIVGEALNQLRQVDPAMAARIPDIRAVIGFRNVLVHGYAAVDQARVWRTINESLPDLLATLTGLLAELDA